MNFEVMEDVKSIPVHIASSDVKQGCSCHRKRRAATFGQITLNTNNPTQRLLPRSTSRITAFITGIFSTTATTIYAAKFEADAQQQSGGAAPIPINAGMPFEVPTTDEVWISAPSTELSAGVVVGFMAITEQEE